MYNMFKPGAHGFKKVKDNRFLSKQGCILNNILLVWEILCVLVQTGFYFGQYSFCNVDHDVQYCCCDS
jgi:hypothetical protein